MHKSRTLSFSRGKKWIQSAHVVPPLRYMPPYLSPFITRSAENPSISVENVVMSKPTMTNSGVISYQRLTDSLKALASLWYGAFKKSQILYLCSLVPSLGSLSNSDWIWIGIARMSFLSIMIQDRMSLLYPSEKGNSNAYNWNIEKVLDFGSDDLSTTSQHSLTISITIQSVERYFLLRTKYFIVGTIQYLEK